MIRVLLLASLCTSGLATAQALLPEDVSTEVLARVRAAEQTGREIFRHDQAASAATDALFEVRGFKRNRQLRGWITEAKGDRVLVTYIGQAKGGQPTARYRVWVDSQGRVEGKPSVLREPEPLTPFEAAAARAQSQEVEFQPCAERYNAVVLPAGESLQKWRKYLLPGTTQHGIVPLGGSYRADIDLATGETEVRGYTKTCIQLESPREAVGLMVSHLLDPEPTEVHVFWSLWAGKPMYVAITEPRTLWSIEEGKIRPVKSN